MKKRAVSNLVIVTLVIILWLAVMPAQAFDNRTTISFTNFDLVASNDLLIYGSDVNGTWSLMAVVNTTTPNVAFDPGVYSIVVRPSAVSRFSNLGTLSTDFLAWFQTNWIVLAALLIFVVILGAWGGGKRRGRRR